MPEIIVSSFWSQGQDNLAAVTWPNKESYCKRHGYRAYWRHHETGNDIMWDRPNQWAQVLRDAPDGTWCLFMGCDTVFTRDRPLEDWIDDGQDALLSVDHYVVFGDVHLWKASPLTRAFMWKVTNDLHQKKYATEQDAFTCMLSGRRLEEYQTGCGKDYGSGEYYARSQSLLNHSSIKVKLLNNSKFTGDDPAHWPPGDIPPHHAWTPDHLILHLGGLSVEKRLEVLPRYGLS